MKITEAPILALDFETTGLSYKNDAIIEWGLATEISASMSRVFNPQRDIPPEVSAVHGYTKKNLSDKPFASKELVEPLVRMIDGKLLLIHNVDFDWHFLMAECERKGVLQPKPLAVLDTMLMAQRMFPELKSHTLGTVYYATGLPDLLGEHNTKWHTGQFDALVTAKIFKFMVDKWIERSGPDDINILLERVYSWRKVEVINFGKHKGCGIMALPEDYMWWWFCKRNVPTMEDLNPDLEESMARAVLDATMYSPSKQTIEAANKIIRMCNDKRKNRPYPTKVTI